MRSRKSDQKARSQSKTLVHSRKVDAQWAVLSKMVGLGFRPARADMARALYDQLQCDRPKVIPRSVLKALFCELTRKGRGGQRETTVEMFWSKIDDPVRASIKGQQLRKEKKQKSPYREAIEVSAAEFGMSGKKLEAFRTRYRKYFKAGDYED